MSLSLHITVPILLFYQPWGTQSIQTTPQAAHVPSRTTSPGPPPWTEPASKAERNFLPNPQILLFISPQENKKCCFTAFFPTHYKCKHTCVCFCVRLPKPGTYPRDHENSDLHGMLEGKKISALRKWCNKSTPVRKRCPQKQSRHEQTVSASFLKLTPK